MYVVFFFCAIDTLFFQLLSSQLLSTKLREAILFSVSGFLLGFLLV